MQVIASTPSCRVQDIARAVAITVGGASQAVDRLEAAGRCVRHPNPDDRRSSILDLTPSGRELLNTAEVVFDQELRDLPRRPAVEERARSARHGARHRAGRGHPGSATADPRPGGRRTTRRARVTPSRRTHVDTSRFTNKGQSRQRLRLGMAVLLPDNRGHVATDRRLRAPRRPAGATARRLFRPRRHGDRFHAIGIARRGWVYRRSGRRCLGIGRALRVALCAVSFLASAGRRADPHYSKMRVAKSEQGSRRIRSPAPSSCPPWWITPGGATPMACPLLLRRSSADGPELRQDTRSDDQVAMESRPRRAAVAERPARSRCWARVFAFAEGFRSYFSSGSVLDQQSVAVQCVRRKRRQEHPGC